MSLLSLKFVILNVAKRNEGSLLIRREHTEILRCAQNDKNNKLAQYRPIIQEFLSEGMLKENIVLGLQPPELRKYTGLGVI